MFYQQTDCGCACNTACRISCNMHKKTLSVGEVSENRAEAFTLKTELLEAFELVSEFFGILLIDRNKSYAASAAVGICSEACCSVLCKENSVRPTRKIVEVVVTEECTENKQIPT